jgi:hypothetical protein
MLYFEAGDCNEEERMNLERLGRGNKVRVAVGVLVVLAVAGGAYLVFADRTVEISNAEELQQVRENPSGNYVLVEDIDLSGIDNFEPIENFTGTFDGNGHTVSNLTIDRPEMDSVGLFLSVRDDTRLFGLTGNEGTVRNVRLEDVNVTGGRFVGSLAGANLGTLTGLSATGEVRGDEIVGGLAGQNEGTVRESYASNNVSGDSVLGGLVGWNYGEVIESYSVSDVSGGNTVGSLVGVNNPIPRTEGTVVRSYATGEVSGEGTGGFIAQTVRGEITDSYWDINSTGQDDSADGAGLTTSEMTGSAARENMDGFNFGETWRSTEDDYPRLVWQDEENDADRTAD